MSEVKWIKITTDMFENRKIRHLRKLPDGNNIVLIWVMLLTLAGKCNAGGMIFLTENIPYTPKMLADELDFEENTVALALDALEKFGMIRRDGFLVIEDWAAHQNADGLDKIREQTRERVARYREKQKALQSPEEETDVTLHNVTESYEVTQSNAPRIRIRIEEDIDKEEDTPIKGGVGGKGKSEDSSPKDKEKQEYTREEFEKDLSVLSEKTSKVVVSWMKYKKEEWRKPYKRLGAKSLITQVKNHVDKYGEDAVIQAIRNSMANGYQGITFDSIGKNFAKKAPDSRREEHDYEADMEGVL